MNVLCISFVLVFYVLLVFSFCSFSALILQFVFWFSLVFCELLLLLYYCFSTFFFFKREIIKLGKEDLGGVAREVRVGSKYRS